MKQVKKQKEKDNYLKFSFLFPIILTAVDAVIMLAFIYVVANQATLTNMNFARLVAQAGTVLLAMSPTGLLITSFVSFKHMKKHPDGSAFYIKTPMLVSVIVWGVQVLYMATLTGA
ncbi:MAG: hypothetical protein IJ410_08165 [Oscillospiraceae bacterium]|nr:hypothetical protein [Oscillospiraceae bacterium]